VGAHGLRRVRQESAMRAPKRLPSPREFALLTWDARLEVIAQLQSLRLAYLKTESVESSTTRQDAV
jgi:hypothetical protein